MTLPDTRPQRPRSWTSGDTAKKGGRSRRMLNERMKMKQIQVHNPGNLPVMSYRELQDFQEKILSTREIEPGALRKLRNSLIKHGVFVPKFTWIDSGTAHIADQPPDQGKALESSKRMGTRSHRSPMWRVKAESATMPPKSSC